MSGLILVDAVGIDVPAHPIADFFALTMAEVQDLSYYNPEAFRMDPETLPPASQNIVAGNRASLALEGQPHNAPDTRGLDLREVSMPGRPRR